MRPELMVLVGISASGKTRFASELSDSGKYVHLSSDAIRHELFGDASYQGDNSKVFEVMLQRTRRNLRNGSNVIYDATNLSSKRRMNLLKSLDKLQFKPICVVFCAEPKGCVNRDSNRDRTVGAQVIRKQINQFEVPMYFEGWEEIRLVKDIERVNIREIEETMKGFNQMNPHHTLTLSGHSVVTAFSLRQNEDAELETYIAALYHDIGKLYTRKIDDNGIAHYYNHDSVGAYYFLCSNIDEIIFLENDDSLLRIAFLISKHMIFYSHNEKGIERLKNKIGEELYNQLYLLHKADQGAH